MLFRSKVPQFRVEGDEDVTKIFNMPTGAILVAKKESSVKAGDVLAKIPRSATRTRDITGGLPRVTELFEARNPSNPAVVAEIDGVVTYGVSKRGNQEIIITSKDEEVKHYQVPLSKHILVHDGDYVRAGQPLSDGAITPQDILRIEGPASVQRYVLNGIQEVYRLQGVTINDKHIEVIVRQMLRRVVVENAGDSNYIAGEQVERSEILNTNEALQADGKLPATYSNVLLGITKASLSTDSFISAASFQETTRVLTEAAIMGKRDDLRGLKENVIVGRLIPAGSGMAYHKARKEKDQMDEAERRAIADAEAAELAADQAAASSSEADA